MTNEPIGEQHKADMSVQAATQVAMGMAAFAALLEQYGASERRWPDTARARALALLAQSPDARCLLGRAERLDQLLDGMEAPAIGHDRVARVVAGSLAALPVPGLVPRQHRLARHGLWASWREWWPVWPRAAGLAACTIAGMVVGLIAPPGTGHGDNAAVNAMAALQQGSSTDLPTALFTQSTLESLFQ